MAQLKISVCFGVAIREILISINLANMENRGSKIFYFFYSDILIKMKMGKMGIAKYNQGFIP